MVSETKRGDGTQAALQSYDFERSVGYWLILAARAYQKFLYAFPSDPWADTARPIAAPSS